MTARELIKALDKFEGSSEVMIEVLSRDNGEGVGTGNLLTKVMGTVDVVTHSGNKVYISTWGKEN